jgi:replicative DNA helicase
MARYGRGANGNGKAEEPQYARIPHDLKAEEALVASMLVEPEEARATCLDLVDPSIFSDPGLRDLTNMLKDWSSQGREWDVALLSAKLPETITETRLVELMTNRVPSAVRMTEYHTRVLDVWRRREYWSACFEGMQRTTRNSTSAHEVRRGLENAIDRIERSGNMPSIWSAKELMPRTLEAIRPARERTVAPALRTWYDELDQVLVGGLHPGWMYVLAARPSIGKSTLCLNIASNVASHGHPAMVVSLETRAEALLTSVLARSSRVDSYNLLRGLYSPEGRTRLMESAQAVEDFPLYLCDECLVTLGSLRTMARQAHSRYALELLVVDYLQLMEPDMKAESRQCQVAALSRGVKLLAKELSIPIILVCQLSRAPEGRNEKRPRLSDLRESGAIEQDADAVLFLYRDAYYNKTADPSGAEVAVAKQRHGPTGIVRMQFEAQFNAFKARDMESEPWRR